MMTSNPNGYMKAMRIGYVIRKVVIDMGITLGRTIDVASLPAKRSRGTDWLPILRQVPEGQAKEINVNYGTLGTVIVRLVKAAKIRKGEYAARVQKQSTGQKDAAGNVVSKTTVFLAHYKAGTF
jgi:hypothetical protein